MVPQPTARTEQIDDRTDGQRLDNFLSRMLRGVPKSHVYQLIRSGQVRVNGRRARADTRLVLDDQVRVPPVRMKTPTTVDPVAGGMRQRALAGQGGQLPVVHEDEGLLVIDKPAGTAVHGGSGISSGVIEQLRAARPQARFLELVHRLDRDTSGLLMVAKTRRTLVAIHDMLRSNYVEKRYVAIVLGSVPARDRTIRLALRRTVGPAGERVVVVDPDGKEAITTVTGLRRMSHPTLGTLSLVGLRLGTGRTHQIRVHLAAHDWPILGDSRYGRFESNRLAAAAGVPGMFLHARELSLVHPLSGTRIRLRSSWPQTFASLFDEPVAPAACAHGRSDV